MTDFRAFWAREFARAKGRSQLGWLMTQWLVAIVSERQAHPHRSTFFFYEACNNVEDLEDFWDESGA